MTPPSIARGAPAVALAAVALGAAVLAAAVWNAGLLLTTDGPQHILGAMAHLSMGTDAPFAHVERANEPLSGAGPHHLFALFTLFSDWVTAYRLVLVLCAIVHVASFTALVVALAPGRAPLAITALGTALHVPFLFGVLPFSLSVSVSMFALALGVVSVRVAAPSRLAAWLRTGALAGLLFLSARLHVLPAALAGGTLVVTAWFAMPDARSRVAAIARLALAGVPAIVVAIGTLAMVDELRPSRTAATWWPLDARLLLAVLPRRVDGALLLVTLSLGAALAWARGATRDRALCTCGVAMLVASATLPRDFLGWELAAIRFALPGTLCVLAAVPLERLSARPARALAATGAVLSVFWLAQGGRALSAQRDACAEALALLPTQQPDPRLVSQVVLLPSCGVAFETPNMTPAIHLSSLYAVPRRTLGEFAHASSEVSHSIKGAASRYAGLRFVPPHLWQEAATMTGDVRRRRLTELARDLRPRPLLLVYGPPEDLAWLQDLGWRAEERSEKLFLGHFEGCSFLVASEATDIVVARRDVPDVRWTTARVGDQAVGAPCGSVRIAVGGATCDLELAPGVLGRAPCADTR